MSVENDLVTVVHCLNTKRVIVPAFDCPRSHIPGYGKRVHFLKIGELFYEECGSFGRHEPGKQAVIELRVGTAYTAKRVADFPTARIVDLNEVIPQATPLSHPERGSGELSKQGIKSVDVTVSNSAEGLYQNKKGKTAR